MTLSAPNVPALLDALVRSDPGRPRLTWYGDDGGRVELSARVLANWVAKSANLLVEEFDAGPGVTVTLNTPAAHWKTLVLALAVSATGAQTGDDGDVVIDTVVPADVVVELAALARRHDGDVGTAIDYAAVITGYDDVFIPVDPSPALIETARREHPAADGGRLMITDTTDDPASWLVSALLGDGSLVVAPATADLERIAAQEGATRV